jgi:hypothetical protein
MKSMTRWTWLSLAAAVALSTALPAAATAGMPRDKSLPLVVVDDGGAPGSRYRHVVYHTTVSYKGRGGAKQTIRAWCNEFRLLGAPKNGYGHCHGAFGAQPSPSSIPPVGAFSPVLAVPGKADADVYVAGNTSARVDRVRVVYRDPSGREQDLKVDFAKLDRARLAKVAKRVRAESRSATRLAKAMRRLSSVRPYGVFTALLPGDVSMRDGLVGLAKTRESSDVNQRSHDLVKTGNLGGLTWDGDMCDEWSGPFRVIAYDANGRELTQDRCQRPGATS